MPKYFYLAKTQKGEEKKGSAQAQDEFALARSLKREGLVLIFAEERGEKEAKIKINLPFLKRVSLMEKMIFTRNLAVMISAGISLPRVLETLAKQVKSKEFKKTILLIKDEIIKGNSFSDSLAKHPKIFSEVYSSMIKVGEEGGRLEEVLNVLARQMEREKELKAKIQGALIYPAVVVLAMVGIGILMLLVVVPRIGETFAELEVDLPVTTQFVINLGNAFASYWYLILAGLMGFVVLFWQGGKTKKGKRMIDRAILKIPIVSLIIKKTNSAYTARTLSSLISSGVPITRALEILAGALGNVYYQEAMRAAAEKVTKGGTVSEALLDYTQLYPILIIQMIEVGEETGQTSEILLKLADFFEEEVANTTKNLTTIIEPVVMLLIGGAIGFFAVSMIQPMYTMLDAIK